MEIRDGSGEEAVFRCKMEIKSFCPGETFRVWRTGRKAKIENVCFGAHCGKITSEKQKVKTREIAKGNENRADHILPLSPLASPICETS